MNNKITISDGLIFLAMLYIVIDLSSMVFAYKFIQVGSVVGAASSLIFPATYALMDVIAEVYGYQVAKKIILYGFICDFIFAVLVLLISHIPSTSEYQTLAYLQIFSILIRAVFAQMIGVLTGAFINVYLISKWKMITKGRYFWLRSIGSSMVGEAVMLVISVFIALSGVLSFATLFRLIIYTYIYKICFAVFAAPIISIVALILKNKIDNWRPDAVDFNPFSTLGSQDSLASFQKL